jgi:hypothetical protein
MRRSSRSRTKVFRRLTVDRNTVIKIVSFDQDTETFCIFRLTLGNAFMTIAALVDAVPSLSSEKVSEAPEALLGQQFTTAKQLKQ